MTQLFPGRGAPPFGRLSPRGEGGLRWVNISAAFAAKVAADYAGTAGATNATFASSAAGTVTAARNNVLADGHREGPSVSLPIVDVFPEYADGFRRVLFLNGVRVAGFADFLKVQWQSLCLTDALGAAQEGVGMGISQNVFSQLGVSVGQASMTGGDDGSVGVSGTIEEYEESANFWRARVINDYPDRAVGCTATRLTISWGCGSSANDGVYGGTVQWWGAMVNVPFRAAP